MKKIITISTALILLLIVNCGASGHRTLEQDSDVLVPLLQGSSSESISKQMDVNDLGGCQILIKQGEWVAVKGFGFGRDQTWLEGNGWLSEGGISLDSAKIDKSYKIGEMADKNERFSHKDSRLVYLGPWKYVEKLGKQIRLISIQENDLKEKSGAIRNFYESLDSQNQKIPEMSLKLLKPAYGDEFCILKWHIKYGYNGIAETYKRLRPGFWAWVFRDYETVITGKIIEAKE